MRQPRIHLNVLLIDDDEKFLQHSRRYLELTCRWTCATALSGEAGLRWLEETGGDVDVVVVDMDMPEMDGYQVIRAIRQSSQWRHLCIVVFTGSQERRETEKALQAIEEGADGYLKKPIFPEDIAFGLQVAYEYKRLKERQVEDVVTLARGVMHQVGPRLTTVGYVLKRLEKRLQAGKADGLLEKVEEDLFEKAEENLRHTQALIEGFQKYPISFEACEGVHLAQKIEEAFAEVKERRDFIYGELDQCQVQKEGLDSPLCIIGNADLIKETFINIFDNALQAMMGSTRKQLQISVGKTKEQRVEVRISDSGHGIKEDDMESIFKPFFTTRQGKGTGLGLPFAQTVINQHGGTITVESKLGEGTTFTVLFPLALAESQKVGE